MSTYGQDPAPEGIQNPLKLPLPWRPSEQATIKRAFFMDKGNRSVDIRDYLAQVDSQYVITGIGIQAVEMAVGYMSVGAHVFYPSHQVDMTPEDMQRQFEQEVLGLQPLQTSTGLRHRESPAGFGGGIYPIEPFADLVGIEPQELNEILRDEQSTRFGHVILRSADYIVPVKTSHHDESLVSADRATKLSESGMALVDTALSIADYSTRS